MSKQHYILVINVNKLRKCRFQSIVWTAHELLSITHNIESICLTIYQIHNNKTQWRGMWVAQTNEYMAVLKNSFRKLMALFHLDMLVCKINTEEHKTKH